MKHFLVLVMRTLDFEASLVPAHAMFLDRLRSEGRIERAGPFVDNSGGAYVLRAQSLETARAMAERDPLHASGASRISVHEWEAR
jgi:uncharacterized protein YciI